MTTVTTTNSSDVPEYEGLAYSFDDKNFTSYKALFRALDNEGHLYVGQVIYVASKIPGSAASFLRADSTLSLAQAMAVNEGDDPFTSMFSDVTDAARMELQELLNAWAKKHIQGNCDTFLGESRPIELTESMISTFYASEGLDKVPSRMVPPEAVEQVIH